MPLKLLKKLSPKSDVYKVIRNAISKELVGFCYDYFRTKRKVTKLLVDTGYIPKNETAWGMWNDPQAPDTYSHYGDIGMETLLLKVQPILEKELSMKLSPTYSFARLYKNGDELVRHKDRYSCEVSATLNLGGDPWSIFLEPSGKQEEEGLEVLLEPGDMLIYEGEKMEHWREKFNGESCGQVFLHYNDASLDGAEKNKYDGRPFLGLPPWFAGFKLKDDYNCN